MSILDDAYEFFTGRDPKAADVYADYDRVADVTDRINQIAKNDVDEAKEAIQAAIQELNNVNGFQQYVGSLPTNTFDSTLDTVSTAISDIGTAITSAAEDIKAYEEAPWYEKGASTVLMGLSKFGEGALGVLEDLGDGLLSVGGFVAGGLGFDTTGIENVIEADWSHDAFNFYYESDLAKASAFTEDSAIAGGIELLGNTAGYLALGSGIGTAIKGTGVLSKTGKVAKTANLLFGTGTRANTTVAALSGLGSGTESGIKQGMSLNEAVMNGGLQQGVTQGVIAGVGGKLGEKSAKTKAIKEQQAIVDKADDILKAKEGVVKARKDYYKAINGSTADDATKAALKQEWKSAQQKLDDITGGVSVNKDVITAQKTEALNKIDGLSSAKWNTFDPYTDPASNFGKEKLAHPFQTVKSGAKKASEVLNNVSNLTKDDVVKGAQTMWTNAKTSAGNTLTAGKQKAGEVFQAAKTSLKEHPFKTVGGTAFKVATAPVTIPFKAGATVLKTAASNPAQTAAFVNAGVKSNSDSIGNNAAAQFASDVTIDAPETASLEAATGQPIPQDATPQDTTPQDTSNNTSGGGSSPTGGNGNGNSGGNGGGGGSASTQFRIDSSTTPSGNTGGTSGNTTPTVNAPEVETPSTNTPSTETPSTGGTPSTETPDTGTNGDMSGDISTGEEQVPETPSTSTPDAGTPGGVAGNIVNNAGSTGGTSGSTGGNYSGSVVGGFNSQSQNTPIGPEAQLNPEDNIANIAGDNSEIENGTISAVKPGKDNTLDVISIDKNDTTTPNVDTSSAGSAIPAVLGVGAAGAAGVAGIHYIQKKNGKDDEYYEDEEDSSNDTQNSFLGGNYNAQNIDTIGEYDNSQQEPEPEKYRAGTMNELSLDDGADVTIDDNDIIAPQKEELE